MGDLKLFSYSAAFSNVLNFASEPKKPEQDLKGTKSADTAKTSEKASDQGKGWGSWCSLQYPTHLICLQVLIGSILTLVTQTSLPPPSNLLSTAPLPPNQTAMGLEGLLQIQRRGHPQSLISACALYEFRLKFRTWKSCIMVPGNLLCRARANPLKILWKRWVPCPQDHWEQLPPPLVSKDPQETQPTCTKATAFLCSYYAASSGFLLIMLASSFLAPHRLGYKAGQVCPFPTPAAQDHRERLTVPSVFFLLAVSWSSTVQPKKSHSCWFFQLSCFVFLLSPLSALFH